MGDIMKIKINNNYVKWGLTAFAVVVASICFGYLLLNAESLLSGLGTIARLIMPILFGLLIAYLMTPIMNYTENRILIPWANRLKIKKNKTRRRSIRAISIIVTSVFVFAIVYILVAMMVSQIVPSIRNIIINSDTYVKNLGEWLNNVLENNPSLEASVNSFLVQYSAEIDTWINENVWTKASELIKSFSLGLFATVGVLWDFIIGYCIAIYLLAGKETFTGQAKKVVYALFSRETANKVIKNTRFTHKTFIGFLSGKVLDSIIIGILCFIGTSFLNTPYAALVSMVIGVTNVIPFFGPFIGAIPCSILIFVVDPMHPLNCLYFVIFIFLLQQFDGNVLGPKILGDSTGLTGFWVIFSITLFGGIIGIPGMIIGVPVFAVIYAACKSLVNTSLKKKLLTSKTKDYIRLEYIGKDGVYHQMPAEDSTKSAK